MKNRLTILLNYFTVNRLTYILLFFITLILIESRQTKITNFNCEICADKAGYYMFLPAVFHMGFEAENYTENFQVERGNGFILDKKKNKIITKFTYGLSLLLSPFYALGALIAYFFSINEHPYSNYYLFFINIGAAFYITLGLFYLNKFFKFYFSKSVSFLTVMIVFFGTNLYYYSIDETLMSHLYSFSLFSILLYGIKTFYETKQTKHFLLFAIPFALAVLIRPTNILFGVFVLFLDVDNMSSLKSNLKMVLQRKNIAIGLGIYLIILIPQMLYWNFAYGQFLPYTYGEEGFTNWYKPRLINNWFSPHSGFFTYTPIALLSIYFSIVMIFRKQKNAVLVLAVFLISSYMCASWHLVNFGGCNFGKRPMVEYLPLIMFPIGYLLSTFKNYRFWVKLLIILLIITFVSYNLILFRRFDTCFFGDTWEWSKFWLLVKEAYMFK